MSESKSEISVEKIKFLNDVIKPWEVLNRQLSFPFSINTSISDFTVSAGNLAISIKHFPESIHSLNPKDLSDESQSYRIISDLADSLKHGNLRDKKRNCVLFAGSMFERSKEGLVRFLRNTINIKHNTFGDCDFLQVAKDSALFVASKIDFRSSWVPSIIRQSGGFSNKIQVHASVHNQIAWSGMTLQFVEITPEGEYKMVDLNSTIEFTLTVDETLATPR